MNNRTKNKIILFRKLSSVITVENIIHYFKTYMLRVTDPVTTI